MLYIAAKCHVAYITVKKFIGSKERDCHKVAMYLRWLRHTPYPSWQGELDGVPIKFPILLIQLLYGLCTTFPLFPCDLVMWYFLTLHPCVVSPKKKRKINNDLAVLPSHDKLFHRLGSAKTLVL